MHAPCVSQARACVLCAKLLQCCCPRTYPARDPGAMQRQVKTFFALHTVLFTPRTSHSTLHLMPNHVSSSHLISALLISSHLFSHVIQVSSSQLFSSHPSTDQPFSSPQNSSQLISAVLHARNLLLSERSLLHKKTLGRRNFCTKKLETQKHLHRKAFKKYFELQKSLHKAFPPSVTTLYHQPCTKHFPVLLCTTKLARSTSQYYFVPQSLECKVLPSTTLYYKACTKSFPVLLCTTKLAQRTSQ